jgi:hypothetical protein
MIRIFVPLILFVLQVYLVFKGASHFGMLGTPFVLLAVSIPIPLLCLRYLLKERDKTLPLFSNSWRSLLIGGGLGAISISIFYKKIQATLDSTKDYGSQSDVIPQLETLYNRFAQGIFPYAPLEQYPWHPYPVYMPLNWLPVGLAGPLHCDVRWIGILFLAVGAILWGIWIWRTQVNVLLKLLLIALPAYILWAVLQWDNAGIGVTLESLIIAFYFLLAYGLLTRNLSITVAGIICCILSRYTMIFWLPLFLFMLWQNTSKKSNYFAWISIVAAVLLLYIVPFYLKDPSILAKGLAYHNHCYVDAWNGLGNPEEATVFNEGLNFSWFIREYTSGSMEHRVFIGRCVQGGLMLVLLLVACLGYRKSKNKIHFYDYSLIALYCFLLLFFISSPLTYKYYYYPFFIVSALVVARIMIIKRSQER